MSDDVNLEEFVMTKDEFSGADIKAICTEAGLLALRERRMKVRMLVVTDIMSITFIYAGLVCLCPRYYHCSRSFSQTMIGHVKFISSGFNSSSHRICLLG